MSKHFSPTRINTLILLLLIAGPLTQAQEACNLPGAAENLKRAEAFLADNKNKDGVITTESGLQYRIVQAGTGDKHPRSRDMVSTHYTLRNLDGNKIDSSFDRSMPLQFVVTEVIAGWQEALQLMTKGQKIELFVPPYLGYKCKGSPPAIGPNELLLFEVELIDIVR